jgi:peroxiredoxin
MRTQKIRGPLVSIAAVAIAGTGLWLVNTAAEPGSGPAVVSVPAAVTQTTAATPVSQFPSAAKYSGDVPTAQARIVIDMTVTGGSARAYVCDGYAIETWLSGAVTGDTVSLASADGSGKLTGRLQVGTVQGTLVLGERSWDFSAPEVSDGR